MKTSTPPTLNQTLDLLVDLLLPYITQTSSEQNHSEANSPPAQAND